MTRMSVYRQNRELEERDHVACIEGSASAQDIDLIDLSLRTKRPVRVGLDGETTIIKPFDPNDAEQDFASLLDIAWTATDLAGMRRHRVKTPDDIPQDLFLAHLVIGAEVTGPLVVYLKAANQGSISTAFRRLCLDDPAFHERVIIRLSRLLIDRLIHNDIEVVFGVKDVESQDYRPLDPPLDPAGPQWRIVEDEIDDTLSGKRDK